MVSRTRRLLIAGAGIVALVGALPATPATAARPKPVARPFVAHGLVLGHTTGTVTVLAASVQSGRTKAGNKTITVSLPSRRTAAGKALAKKLARTRSGDRIAVNGTERAGAYSAKNLASTPAPYHAYLGTVSAVEGSLLRVAKAATPSDDADEPDTGTFTVDVSGATVTVDGAPGELAVGETAAVLGSSVHDVVVATAVFAYTVAPDAISGEVTGVTDSVATLSTEDGDTPDAEEGDAPAAPAVDLTGAALVVDGVSDAPADAITAGARLLALGTDHGDGTFAATVAFAFTRDLSSRDHGDGGQGSDDS